MLVVVEATPVPERLLARARHVVRGSGEEPPPALVAELRSHLPRDVGVIGPPGTDARWAATLHRAGLPVVLHSDTPPTGATSGPLAGVEVRPVTDPGPPMEAADSILDLFGPTPMVRLDRMARGLSCHLLGKLEMLSPGGSVKDKPALAMIEAAEQAGLLKPGGTIVEPTSGNTGVGLAIVAARRRYRCIFVMPDKVSQDKISLLRAYGAEVIVCPTTVAPDHPDSYYSVSQRLTDEVPGAYKPDQYHNPANPASHVESTGPDIWRQTAGRITHFVASVGTGGTITGVSRYLKSQNPAIQVVGADPEGSVFSGGTGRPYLVEGIGEDFWPSTYDPDAVDRIVMVSDRDSFLTARRITREEGILVGGSCGTAVWAAIEVGRELGPEDVVVVMLPDSGRGYLSKLYNDSWMADFGFLRAGGQTVSDVLTRKEGRLPSLVHVHPDETVRAAISLLREYDVSQLPVLKAEPPVPVAEVVGAVQDRDLMEKAFADPGLLDQPVGQAMGPPLPTVGVGEPVDVVVELLERTSAVLVLDAGHPVGVLTRSDVLEFLAHRANG